MGNSESATVEMLNLGHQPISIKKFKTIIYED